MSEWSDFPREYMNAAHGHVTPRGDGAKARCGGPSLCMTCKLEEKYLQLLENYRRESRERFAEKP